MTHAELVERAAAWLRARFRFVATELGERENADAFALNAGGYSTLVECKASRADFLADRDKHFRSMPDRGMGDKRYYLCPAGLLTADEMPEAWGLLYADGKRIRVIKEATTQPKNERYELALMLTCVMRLGPLNPPGVSVRFYTYQTKNRASVGVDWEETVEAEIRQPGIE